LRDDLNQLKSNGEPVCTPRSKLTARAATDEERTAFVRNAALAEPDGDETVITYLVELDNIPKSWNN
jgi:hypothetical protein